MPRSNGRPLNRRRKVPHTLFTYKTNLHPAMLRGHQEHSGQLVTVVRKESEFFRIRANDGWTGLALDYELVDVRTP